MIYKNSALTALGRWVEPEIHWTKPAPRRNVTEMKKDSCTTSRRLSVKRMRPIIKATLLLVIAGLASSCTSLNDALFRAAAEAHSPTDGTPNELVMTNGMTITAETETGMIIISAGRGLKRTYTWEGASRSTTLWPRSERWYGSLGAYYPGPGEHWRNHNGVTRGVLQEGQQHFESEQEALDWLHKRSGYDPTVYRDDGLVVSFGKTLPRRQINVEVWQILIHDAKPQKLAGSDNSKINVTNANAQ